MKKLNKTISIVILMIILLMQFSSIIFAATDITEAFISYDKDCGDHLEALDGDNWFTVLTCYVEYTAPNGKKYPAYCLDATKPGVGNSIIGDLPDGYEVKIEELLDNNMVYRAVINGYPYKTPEQLGVRNKYDAFMATKQAVYSVIYNYDVNEHYRGVDEIGENIHKAIKNIVNKARNGTETQKTALITFKKDGNFIEDTINNKYYSQTYSVNSDISMKEYKITATAKLPSGSFVADVNGKSKTTFSANEKFKVMIPKESANKLESIEGVLSVQAKCETYPVFYGEKNSELQPYALTYDPYGDNSAQLKLNFKMNTGKIKINKLDDETSQPISGVTFQLMDKDGKVVANSTTNTEGVATFSNLLPGDYKLKEVSTNEKYILNKQEFEVNVEYNGTTTETVTNEHKKGDLKIYKVDKDNNKIVLGNVEFQLYSEEFDKILGTYYTDVNGELKIENLRVGKYTLIETKTNKHYNLAEDTEIEVEWDKETTKNIENELKKGQIRVIKIDEEDNEIKLEGVEFEVLNENDEVLETIITDENGEALTSRYPTRDFSKLKIRETKTLDTYVLSDEVKILDLENNKITDTIFENQRIKGKIEITKVDLKDNTKTLEGAEFGLYDEEGNLIETLITDSEGKATSSELYKGRYYLKELSTESVYYLLNQNTFEFEIIEHEKTETITIENEGTEVEVDVDKEGTTEIKPGEKVNYTFANVENKSNVYLENFKWYDYIPTDYIRLENMTTGTWNQELTYSVYYKTNKSEEYILFKDNLSTQEDYKLDFTTIEFAEDEYIVETCFDFGKVDIGFKESTSPTMECQSLDSLQDGENFTNHTKTVGVYFGVTAEADSKWTTIVHVPEEKHEPVLPRTGK